MQKPTARAPAKHRTATRTHPANSTPDAPPGPQPADLDKREAAAPKTDPRPNPGGYGPFPPYACQAPNGWVTGELWIGCWLSTDVP